MLEDGGDTNTLDDVVGLLNGRELLEEIQEDESQEEEEILELFDVGTTGEELDGGIITELTDVKEVLLVAIGVLLEAGGTVTEVLIIGGAEGREVLTEVEGDVETIGLLVVDPPITILDIEIVLEMGGGGLHVP